jgi:hypothetical protein
MNRYRLLATPLALAPLLSAADTIPVAPVFPYRSVYFRKSKPAGAGLGTRPGPPRGSA